MMHGLFLQVVTAPWIVSASRGGGSGHPSGTRGKIMAFERQLWEREAWALAEGPFDAISPTIAAAPFVANNCADESADS
jgi:hypothetical protein